MTSGPVSLLRTTNGNLVQYIGQRSLGDCKRNVGFSPVECTVFWTPTAAFSRVVLKASIYVAARVEAFKMLGTQRLTVKSVNVSGICSTATSFLSVLGECVECVILRVPCFRC